tara:strand:+ start:43 stop:399 length:357 start_codon:yes stop_codon:yes gene_type:complete
MNLLTAIEQWVDTRAAKQIEIRMADVARMVHNEVQTQLADIDTREAVDAHNHLESRVDSLEQTVEDHEKTISELDSFTDDQESRFDDMESTFSDHPTHEEMCEIVRDTIRNASISIDL